MGRPPPAGSARWGGWTVAGPAEGGAARPAPGLFALSAVIGGSGTLFSPPQLCRREAKPPAYQVGAASLWDLEPARKLRVGGSIAYKETLGEAARRG